MLLRDKVVIITGGGPGMSRKIAIGAASDGAKIVVTARTSKFIEETAAKICNAGRRAIAVAVDVTRSETCRHAAARALTEFGPIDGVVNSAYPSRVCRHRRGGPRRNGGDWAAP